MKMKMQFSTLLILIVAAVSRITVAATTLKHAHHEVKKHVRSPGDASDMEATGGGDDDSSLEDPEMPSGDSVSLEAAAEAEGEGDAADDAALVGKVSRPVKKHREVPPATKHLRATPKVQAAASYDSPLASLQHDLQQEHKLRVGAEQLVKKLTKVLNHTTDALQKKDAEVDQDVRTEKVQAAKLKTQDQELSKQHSIQHAASSRYEQMLSSAKESIASEHEARLAAEEKVSDLAKQLQVKRGLDPLKLKTDLEDLKAQHAKLSSTSADSQGEIAKLRDNVDEAEAARKAKTQELSEKVKEVEHLKKNENDDLTALQLVEQQKAEAMKAQLKKEEADQKDELESRIGKSEAARAAMKDQLDDLNATEIQEQKLVAEEQQQTKHQKARAEKAEAWYRAEKKDVAKAKQELANKEMKLAESNKTNAELKVQAGDLQKAQTMIEALAKANSHLNKTNADQNDALEAASHKLVNSSNTLADTKKKLSEAVAKLMKESNGKKKVKGTVHELLQAMKQKDAQLEIDEGALISVRQELNAVAVEKDVLIKELRVTESKLSEKARDEKELDGAHAEVAKLNTKVSAKDQELDQLSKELQEASARTQDLNTMKAKLTEAAAQQKDLADQLSAAKQHEKDQLAAAAAGAQELRARLAVADQKEKDLKATEIKQAEEIKKKQEEVHKALDEEAKIKANRLADALNAEQAIQQQDSSAPVKDMTDEEFLLSGAAEKLEATMVKGNITKAALLTGKSVLRSRSLQREVILKDKQLKSALTEIQSLKAEEAAKDLELEEVRQSLLRSASIALPTASAQEAAAAKVALVSINGKLNAQAHELGAVKAELFSAKSENSVEKEELSVLKDERAVTDRKVKKLSAAIIKQAFEKKSVEEEFMTFRMNISRNEQLQKEKVEREAAAKKKAVQEAVAKALAAKQAAQKAAEQAAAAQAAAEKQAAEQAKLQQLKAQAASHAADDDHSADDDDDDDGDRDSDGSYASVPWGKIQKQVQSRYQGSSSGFPVA